MADPRHQPIRQPNFHRGAAPPAGMRSTSSTAAGGTSANAPASSSSSAAGVRRNLFQSQLTRRPTPGATAAGTSGPGAGHNPGGGGVGQPSSSSSASAGGGNPGSAGGGGGGGPAHSASSAETLRLDSIDVLSDTSEIVVRDPNGDFYDAGEDLLPPSPTPEDPDETALDEVQENERERLRLAEAVKHHQFNHRQTPSHPDEIMETLKASMRAQTAALADDNWMYEPEEPQSRML